MRRVLRMNGAPGDARRKNKCKNGRKQVPRFARNDSQKGKGKGKGKSRGNGNRCRMGGMKLAVLGGSRRRTMGWVAGLGLAVAMVSVAGAQSEEHGRKWKPLPPTAHVVVTVLKGFNGKPLPNAAVIFHAVREGKNDGNLEVKTNPEGQAIIDVIEIGSKVSVQVIASGFATVAQELDVDTPTKALEIKLQRPKAQVSEYVDNDGKPAEVKPGIQEPHHALPLLAPAPSTPPAPGAQVSPNPPGPLNAPAGAVTIPVQPGAPLPVVPTQTTSPGTAPQTGSAQTGTPQ
jgi:hypothetical protein